MGPRCMYCIHAISDLSCRKPDCTDYRLFDKPMTQLDTPNGSESEPITPDTIEDRKGTTRQFDTGATRDTDIGKHDYEGFYSPLVVERFAAYMTKHRIQSDGGLRDSDNWQKGIPKDAYMKSGFRHFMDWWKEHREVETQDGLEEALCALLFNVQGYLYETLKENK